MRFNWICLQWIQSNDRGCFTALLQRYRLLLLTPMLLLPILNACSPVAVNNPADPFSDSFLEYNVLRCILGNCAARPNSINAVLQLEIGSEHTCAVLSAGNVRCWGNGTYGRLGYANTSHIGDDETPASVGDVTVGGTVTQISAGGTQTCVLLNTGNVRCWGEGTTGRLGYANTNAIGDDETPASANDVNVGGIVTQITAGGFHTCALLNTGNVRCWGDGTSGYLGYANTNTIGDDEFPFSAGDVNMGDVVTQIAAGGYHTCALLNTGNVRCWGLGSSGRLGYANTNDIGDDESPVSVGDVNVGGTVTQIAVGGGHTCALLNTGNVRCWGAGADGRLGYANLNNIGDDETPASAGDVNVGGTVTQIAAAGSHTCALLNTGNVRCWGNGGNGRLGYANTITIGDDETPVSAGDVNVGGTVTQIAIGGGHTCALLNTGNVRCWGTGGVGRLGYANTNDIGDDETPASAGNVSIQ
ncbi:MAG: hypothetical protein KDK39_10760 [Leptospiraceae bacterium]|nr:hypothetical protein [Leptospiraceae bacterium]